ncbi:hypothetical protein RND71_021763 [Anisodus tanguticus]|uniref:Uncharacterized protein n=1 Tax=Anisodus tanguticus TaxID=243964 RepID=A0AAE1RVR1_9SOLA|nr:hypothetical protein RND71_021763 [Anisodus tanguticus]
MSEFEMRNLKGILPPLSSHLRARINGLRLTSVRSAYLAQDHMCGPRRRYGLAPAAQRADYRCEGIEMRSDHHSSTASDAFSNQNESNCLVATNSQNKVNKLKVRPNKYDMIEDDAGDQALGFNLLTNQRTTVSLISIVVRGLR